MRVELVTAVFVFVSALLAVGGVWFARTRRQSAAELEPAAKPGSSIEVAPKASPVPTDERPVLISFPGHEDQFLALGGTGSLSGVLESQRIELLPSGQRVAAAAQAAALLNMPAQAAFALQQSAHLVRLAPETVQALNEGAKFMEVAGKSAGVLRGPNGQIVQLAKFASLSQLPAIAASLGNALALAAIQMQLAAIDKKLDKIQSTVSAILEEDRAERTADLLSLASAMRDSLEQARKAGEVTPRIMGDIEGKGQELDRHIRHLLDQLKVRLSRRRTSGRAEDLEQWVRDDAYQAVRELQELIVASRAWLMQRALYVAHLAASDSEADRIAAEVAWRQAEERRVEVDELVFQVNSDLKNALDFIVETPGRNTLANVVVRRGMSREVKSQELQRIALQLAEVVAAAGVRAPQPRSLVARRVGNQPSADNQRFERQLMRLLPSDETPVLVLEGARVSKWGRVARGAAAGVGVGGLAAWIAANSGAPEPYELPGALVFTERRLLAIRYSEFESRGEVYTVVQRSDVLGADIKMGELHLRHREGKLVLTPSRGTSEQQLLHTVRTLLMDNPAPAEPLVPVTQPRTLWEIEAA